MPAPPESRRQGGTFTRAQARAAGTAQSTIRRRLLDGRWVEIAPRVLVERGTEVTPLSRAWAGQLATGGVVSHDTAADLHGIGAARASTAIHVTVPRELHVDERRIVEHRVRLGDRDVVERDGLRLTSRVRTVVDLVVTLPASAATTYLFRAVQQHWLTEDQLRDEIRARHRMHGTVRLRRLVGLLASGAHSAAERALHELLTEIPRLRYVANATIRTCGRRYAADVLLPEHAIVIEVDGRAFHSATEQFVADRRRQNDLVTAGYTVLRFTWLDLVERPAHVVDTVRRAVAVSG